MRVKKRKVELADMQNFQGVPASAATEIKRQLRAPLLTAFDKWEKAVLRGREEENAEVMAWFHSLLNLEQQAFCVIPPAVQYYL